jgi:hypothetical protein
MIKTTIWCFFSERPKGLILKKNIELKKEKDEILMVSKNEASG